MIRDPHSLWPTDRERDRMLTAARTRPRPAAIRRQMRRELVIRTAMQRLENPDHFQHGPEAGWRSRENARIFRMLNATRFEAYSEGHASGYRFAASFDATSRHYGSRAEWELEAARKREAVA